MIQSPGYVTNLLTSAGMGVTPYLQYIKDYALLGDHFYHSMVNKLMDLGYKNDGWTIDIDEHHIYGSSRVGIHQTKKTLRRRVESYPIEVTLEAVKDIQFMRGKRNYELSNHLGNVQVVISDKRIAKCDTELEIERFEADVLSAVDYYPFGMVMPGRQYYVSSDSSMYRFGFNGKESDNEAKGIGNQYDYGFRIYDSRLGRFLSVDPLISSYPWYTPYQFAGNKPIWCVDIDGLEEIHYIIPFKNDGFTNVQLIFNASSVGKEIIKNFETGAKAWSSKKNEEGINAIVFEGTPEQGTAATIPSYKGDQVTKFLNSPPEKRQFTDVGSGLGRHAGVTDFSNDNELIKGIVNASKNGEALIFVVMKTGSVAKGENIPPTYVSAADGAFDIAHEFENHVLDEFNDGTKTLDQQHTMWYGEIMQYGLSQSRDALKSGSRADIVNKSIETAAEQLDQLRKVAQDKQKRSPKPTSSPAKKN